MSARSKIRHRFEDGETVSGPQVSREHNVTPNVMFHVMAEMRAQGRTFDRTRVTPPAGRGGWYYEYTLRPREPAPEPTLQERVERIEHILRRHRLDGGAFLG